MSHERLPQVLPLICNSHAATATASTPTSASSTLVLAPSSRTSVQGMWPVMSRGGGSSLTPGQIAGVVVASVGGFAIILLCILWLLRRHRKIRRESSGHSHEWDFVPVVPARRGSEATSRSVWRLSGIVGLFKKATSSNGSRWGSTAEKSPLTGDRDRDFACQGDVSADTPMMIENSSPARMFTAQRQSPVISRYGTAGNDSPHPRPSEISPYSDRIRQVAVEKSPLLGEEEAANSQLDQPETSAGDAEGGPSFRTPEIPAGFAGAAAATGLLYNVEDHWTGSPYSRRSGSPVKRAQGYPQLRVPDTEQSSGSSSPARQFSLRRKPPPVLSEFAWLRGQTSDLVGTSSSNRTNGTNTGVSTSSSSQGPSRSGYESGSYQSARAHLQVDDPGAAHSRQTSANDQSPNLSELFYTSKWSDLSYASFGLGTEV